AGRRARAGTATCGAPVRVARSGRRYHPAPAPGGVTRGERSSRRRKWPGVLAETGKGIAARIERPRPGVDAGDSPYRAVGHPGTGHDTADRGRASTDGRRV